MAARKLTPDTTVELAPSELRVYGRNPRKGNVGAVAASLKAHGQYRPIVANIGTNTGRRLEVLAGNHTLKAFRQLAEREPDDPRWNAISVFLVDVDEDQAAKIVLADNRTAEKGSYDNKALSDLLSDVSDNLDGLGYTADDLDDLAGFTGPEMTLDGDDFGGDEDDAAPSGRGTAVYSYSIIFDDPEQKKVWTDFLTALRRQDPDATMPERLTAYIENVMAG